MSADIRGKRQDVAHNIDETFMATTVDFEEILDDILEKDPRYKRDAYKFTLDALQRTTSQSSQSSKKRHVTGEELLNSIRQHAIDAFGPMTRSVIDHWGLTQTEDFGNIVFNLLDKKMLAKTESDSIMDFHEVYDFDTAFGKL